MALWSRIISLIPARSGSKGIPKKNMAMLNGHPLIRYTVDASKKCPRISETYVSSDSDTILDYCGDFGCKRIKRPAAYSLDTSSSNDVVRHFLSTRGDRLKASETLMVYLQPTSPLRTEAHIEEALDLLEQQGTDRLVSLVANRELPFKSFKIDSNGLLRSLFDEAMSNQRRQDLPVTYSVNGAIYTFLLSSFLKHGGFPSNGSIPYVMKREDSVDIDSSFDLRAAEEILSSRS